MCLLPKVIGDEPAVGDNDGRIEAWEHKDGACE